MDLNRVVAQLRADLANLDAAIASLERLQESGGRRRKRSPQLMKRPETAQPSGAEPAEKSTGTPG